MRSAAPAAVKSAAVMPENVSTVWPSPVRIPCTASDAGTGVDPVVSTYVGLSKTAIVVASTGATTDPRSTRLHRAMWTAATATERLQVEVMSSPVLTPG